MDRNFDEMNCNLAEQMDIDEQSFKKKMDCAESNILLNSTNSTDTINWMKPKAVFNSDIPDFGNNLKKIHKFQLAKGKIENPSSDSVLQTNKKTITSNLSKIFVWNKFGRKKNKMTYQDFSQNAQSNNSIYCDSSVETHTEPVGMIQNIKYYNKSVRSVQFNNDVNVIHFIENEILNKTIEPLKKELDQQIRNKELRKEFKDEPPINKKLKKKFTPWHKK